MTHTNNTTQTRLIISPRYSAGDVEWLPNGRNRIQQALRMSGVSMVYSSYIEVLEDGSEVLHPAPKHLFGSVRDDFDFGAVICVDKRRSSVCMKLARSVYARSFGADLNRSTADRGFYLWWLLLRDKGENIMMLPEPLYKVKRRDNRDSGQKQHDYVNPASRAYQLDMEREFSAYLNYLGAFLKDKPRKINIEEGEFPVDASIIIPVRNREGTISDAVRSALSQRANFLYNVIVVNNGSTDGTTEILRKIASEDEQLIVIETEASEGLGIGGCWNRAINSNMCGRFAVQLDSDDVYSDTGVLQEIVDKFRREKCGMLVGSYTLTDYNLNEIAPGLIDHKEWSPLNGRNNLLRINGMGAPRAFYTPLVRLVQFPNVSYGEDYAICLALSWRYEVGRIYRSLYNCRRWGGNSDAKLSVEQVNEHNYYKDTLRTMALRHRMK